MELNLSLTTEEGQKILDVLIKEPYIEVYELIGKIQEQSAKQIEEKNNAE